MSNLDKNLILDDWEKRNEEHNEWLRSVELHDIADRNESYQKRFVEQQKLKVLFRNAEKLSKENKLTEANEILINLIDLKFEQIAPLYIRLAKNYRKQKQFEKEFHVCEYFLKVEQPKYGGDMWKEVFEKRINFSKSKILGK